MNRRNTKCILDLNPRSCFPLADNKLKMHNLCATIGVPAPDLYAVIETHSGLRQLSQFLEGKAEFVVKPNRGSGGRGILVIAGREENRFVRQNGRHISLGRLRQHASSILSGLYSLGGQVDEVLIQQRIVSDHTFEAISYKGTPDLRLILYKGMPAMAMLRLPTKLSSGRANLHQGAIGAGVELTTGCTTRAVLNNRVTEKHPDTGASVIGFQMPHWQEILDLACRVAKATDLGYIGADIVLDRSRGPLLLEVNARPGLAVQIANGMGLCRRFEEIDRKLAETQPVQASPQ